jgi:hypothetical protein
MILSMSSHHITGVIKRREREDFKGREEERERVERGGEEEED